MTFKVVASQGGRLVFDERVEAETPREAREAMKRALGLENLTGLVYAITEIPTALIEEIVAAKMARVTVAGGRIDPARLMREAAQAAVRGELAPIKNRLAALEGRRGRPGERDEETGRKRFDPVGQDPPPSPKPQRREPTTPLPTELRAILGPDWKVIRQFYHKTRSVKQTAAQFDLSINTLKARIRREGWAK